MRIKNAMPSEMNSIGASSNFWAALAMFIPRFLRPIAALILAHFLLPEDFGVLAITLVVVSFGQLIQEAGPGLAYVQYKSESQELRDSTLWLTLLIGFLVAVIFYFLAAPAARLFRNNDIELALKIQCWQILLSGVSAVQLAVLRRKFAFREIAKAIIVPALGPLLIAVPFAIYGWGYWAVICSSLCTALLYVLFLHYLDPWLPSTGINLRLNKELSTFAWFSCLESLALWSLFRMDRVFLGMHVDAASLGLYGYAITLTMLITQMVSIPFVSDAFFSIYSRLAAQPEDLHRFLERNIEIFAFFLFPVCLGISSIAHLAVPIFFPPHWQNLGWLISLLIISPGLTSIIEPYSIVLRAMGRPHVYGKLYLYSASVSLSLFYFVAKFGLSAFVWSVAGVRIIILFLLLLAASRNLGISFRELLKPMHTPLAASLGMVAVIHLILGGLPGETPLWHQFVLSMGVGAFSYATLVSFLDRHLLKRFCSVVKESWFSCLHG